MFSDKETREFNVPHPGQAFGLEPRAMTSNQFDALQLDDCLAGARRLTSRLPADYGTPGALRCKQTSSGRSREGPEVAGRCETGSSSSVFWRPRCAW